MGIQISETTPLWVNRQTFWIG